MTARAGEEDHEVHFTATIRANPHPQEAGTEYFSLDVEDVPAARSRPDRLAAVRPQEQVQRHTVEQLADCVPVVPLFDVPVPQMVDQLVVVLQGLDKFMPVEEGIEMPKISQDSIPQRAVLQAPQLVEQLVEVPVPEMVVLAHGRNAAGVRWCQIAARRRGLLVDGRHTPFQVGPPGGIHRQPRAENKYWTARRRSRNRSWTVIMQPEFQQSVPQFQFIDRVLDIPVMP